MYRGILEKFRQNEHLLTKLLATGNEELVEFAPWDGDYSFWGVGVNGSGGNHTGKILMRIRQTLGDSHGENSSSKA